MPKGRKLSNHVKSEIISDLMNRLDLSVPQLAAKHGVSAWTLHTLSGKLGGRPRGSASPAHPKHGKKVSRG